MRRIFLLLSLGMFVLWGCVLPQAADKSDAAIAGPSADPAKATDAVIQVYGARTVGAKGIFGVHTWVAVKPNGGRDYTVYEVIGWRQRYGASPVVIHQRRPDGRWFGAEAELLAERRGPGTDELIARVDKAAREYPWPNEYSVWPGPNSNTFTAWIARAVPELRLDLPATAIGKDYSGTRILGAAPSGSGLQLTLFGLLGLTASPVEGIEVNVLGQTLGINPFDFSLKLPLVGRVGLARSFAAKPVESPQAAVSP
jgi:hypothetical protein